MRLRFTVPGVPVPQGSMRVVGDGRQMIHSNHAALKPWRDTIAWHAVDVCPPGWNIFQPMTLDAGFYFPRPGAHLGKHHALRPSAPPEKTTVPDLDKLLRALCDALTGARIWHDDKQLVAVLAWKQYAEPAEPGRLTCEINALTPGTPLFTAPRGIL